MNRRLRVRPFDGLCFDAAALVIAACLSVLFTFGALAFINCVPAAKRDAASARDAIVAAANTLEPSLLTAYAQQQDDCVTTATSRAGGQACLARVRATWEPLWSAWHDLAQASDVVSQWCGVAALLPPPFRLPALEGVACGSGGDAGSGTGAVDATAAVVSVVVSVDAGGGQ